MPLAIFAFSDQMEKYGAEKEKKGSIALHGGFFKP